MVYRGKPSAGCENCRKAKKRCDLEQPACLRCVKLKKTCTGYRDTSQLQIHDESEAVRQKAERQKIKHAPPKADSQLLAPPATSSNAGRSPAGIPTPMSTNSDSSSGSDNTIEIEPHGDPQIEHILLNLDETLHGPAAVGTALMLTMPNVIQPKPNDVASNYFFYQFTSFGHWEYIRDIARQPKLDPCLEFAIRACGMAALTNVELVPAGKAYAQSNYVEALGLLNHALQDARRSRSDEALIAVSMLGFYENIVCDSHHSMMSWKAHTAGATQMLKMRGKSQFKTHVGRTLFREIRSQVIIACIWDDRDIPDFLLEYQSELEAQTPQDLHGLWKLGDRLTYLYYRLARMRKQVFAQAISLRQALDAAAELEHELIQWSVDAATESEYWQYYELEVEETEHVWDGKVYAYAGHPAPAMMNQFRTLRIILSRSQENLYCKLAVSGAALAEQQAYFRRTRREMTDEICKTIPACLGHAGPAFNSSCVLITAYTSVWTLFFAATVLVERVGPDAKYILYGLPPPRDKPQTLAYAQLSWVLGRLRYISDDIGLKWADGVARMLRGEAGMRRPPQRPYE